MKQEGRAVFPVLNRKMCWVILVTVVLILVVPSLQCAAPECQSPAYGIATSGFASERSLGPASLKPVATFDFHLHFKDSVIGERWIDAPLTMEVVEDHNASTGDLVGYCIGYSFDYIVAFNPLLAPGLLGIGFDWFSYYPYFHNSSGEGYDFWMRGHYQEAGPRKFPFWSATGSMEADVGVLKPSDLDNRSRYGEYIFLHEIFLYFQNNVTVECSPNDLLLWTEFQWNGTGWTSSSKIWDSFSKQTVLGSQVADLSVIYPLDPAKIIISIAVPSLVALIAYRKRDALRARFHQKSSVELEGSDHY